MMLSPGCWPANQLLAVLAKTSDLPSAETSTWVELPLASTAGAGGTRRAKSNWASAGAAVSASAYRAKRNERANVGRKADMGIQVDGSGFPYAAARRFLSQPRREGLGRRAVHLLRQHAFAQDRQRLVEQSPRAGAITAPVQDAAELGPRDGQIHRQHLRRFEPRDRFALVALGLRGVTAQLGEVGAHAQGMRENRMARR